MTNVENTSTDLPRLTDKPLCFGRTQFLREGVLGGSLFPQVEKAEHAHLSRTNLPLSTFEGGVKKSVPYKTKFLGPFYPLKRLWNHSLISILDCGFFSQAVIHTCNLAKPLGLLQSTCIHISSVCVVLPGIA